MNPVIRTTSRCFITPGGVTLWVSKQGTELWSRGHIGGGVWLCSQLAGKALRAEFDRNGLVDYAVSGRQGKPDIDGTEFSALCADFLRAYLPESHPCYLVAVGQFDSKTAV